MPETSERVPLQWLRSLLTVSRAVFWFLLLALVFHLLWSPYRTESVRAKTLDRLQQERNSRVIAMIHRADSLSVLGVSLRQSIGIEDSEAILRAIRLTPTDQPIDLILHTPGGMVLAAEQIARALLQHPGRSWSLRECARETSLSDGHASRVLTKLVEDEELREAMREKGLGTPATRAA